MSIPSLFNICLQKFADTPSLERKKLPEDILITLTEKLDKERTLIEKCQELKKPDLHAHVFVHLEPLTSLFGAYIKRPGISHTVFQTACHRFLCYLSPFQKVQENQKDKSSERIIEKIMNDLNQSIYFDFPDFFLKVLYEMKLEVEKKKGSKISYSENIFEMENDCLMGNNERMVDKKAKKESIEFFQQHIRSGFTSIREQLSEEMWNRYLVAESRVLEAIKKMN